MVKHGKKYNQAKERLEARSYSLEEAVKAAKASAYAGFDETMEVAFRLAVDPKHADQMVRGSVVLPHGTGGETRVAVFATGEKVKEAEEAGADVVGGEDLAKKVADGWMDFDAVVATPDMMKEVGKLGRVLGPRGLMPNPKAGTVTFDVGKAVTEIKAGKVEFRVEKAGILQAVFGKASFEESELKDNLMAVMRAVIKARPATAKGKFVKSMSVSSTMGPGVRVDDVAAVAEIAEA